MSNDKMREEFEAWIKVQEDYFGDSSESLNRCDEDPDEYLCGAVHGAWLGWQASREALVIDLPKIVGYEGAYDSFRDNDFAALPDEFFDADETYGLCRSIEVSEAIEAAGVKVKS